MSTTYEVKKVLLSNPSRTVWTVLEYRDGVCLGGDHHWLTEAAANAARDTYAAEVTP